MQKIYLAGPISGCTFEGCTDWRNDFTKRMPNGIQCLSPMRGKDYLKDAGVIEGDYPDHVLSCSRGIMSRDFFDCNRADLVVVNLLGTERVSIGTCMEIAWCYQNRIPTIVMIEDSGNVHDHPMIKEAISFRVKTVEEAVHVANVILADPSMNAAGNSVKAKIPLNGVEVATSLRREIRRTGQRV